MWPSENPGDVLDWAYLSSSGAWRNPFLSPVNCSSPPKVPYVILNSGGRDTALRIPPMSDHPVFPQDALEEGSPSWQGDDNHSHTLASVHVPKGQETAQTTSFLRPSFFPFLKRLPFSA